MNLTMNQLFLDKFFIKETIGCGSFGKVFRIENQTNQKSYALKVDITQKGSVLMESKTLSELQNILGVPKLYKYGITDDFSYMICELLGDNLSKVLKSCNGKFCLDTVAVVIKQILERIQSIHQKGYLHRDLKPHQILLSKSKRILYLTDFGLSRKFEVNSYHISYQSSCPRIGNATFSSLSNHSGVRQSRRDDLESLGYMAVYFYKGRLPWQSHQKMNTSSKWQWIFQVKNNCKLEDLCLDCPKEFMSFISYARSLKFEEKPNYEYLFNLIDLVVSREHLLPGKLDWMLAEAGSKSMTVNYLKVEKKQKEARKQARSRTVFCKGRVLPDRESVLYDWNKRKLLTGYDESSYNLLEKTDRNVYPEFKNREIIIKEKSENNCFIM